MRSPHAASPGGFACPSLPLGSSERARERLPAEAMALHVPKAPGFAQMLKEGAKVRHGGRGSEVGELPERCGGRSEGAGPAHSLGVLPGHSGRRKGRFQKGRCSGGRGRLGCRDPRAFSFLPFPEGAEAARGRPGRRIRVLCFLGGQAGNR